MYFTIIIIIIINEFHRYTSLKENFRAADFTSEGIHISVLSFFCQPDY